MRTSSRFLVLSGLVSLIFLVGCQPSTKESTGAAAGNQESYPDKVKNLTMYEVNVRQYTPEGTFKAFEAHIPRLKKMGIGILWFMPIHPIGLKNRKGSLGSYYSVQDYKGINPEFGTLDDFKRVVDKAHELGMEVIIDWVANHT